MLTQDSRATLEGISDLNRLKLELNELPAIDVGDYIAGLEPEQQALTFRLLNKTQATDVFEYLPPEVRETLIGSLHNLQVCQIVESMRPDDRAELFDELPAGIVKRLVQQLSPEERQATATILGYAEGTAGRVMTTEYVRLREGLTVGEALSKIRLADRDKETVYYAYVTDNNRKLKQVVSLRQLVFSIPDAKIEDIGSDRVIKARTEMQQETEKLRNRLPWLLGIMALYIGASSAISPFQSTIAAVPVLAVIMPLFSNTGGTVGIQALTVTIRSLGIGEVTSQDTLRILKKELLAGLGTALALGLTMFVLSPIWTKPEERWVGVVAAIVMASNSLVAVTLGTLLPMGLKRLKLDPALISGPLVTTLLDSIGFITFLTLITISLNVLKLPT